MLSQGIAENFIGILRSEERQNRRFLVRQLVFAALLLLIVGLAIDLVADGRFFGVGFGVVALALALATALGVLWGRTVTMRRWDESLARHWNKWMRFSVACSRVEEVHRRVRGRPATRSTAWAVTFWSLLLFVTLILLLFTVLDGAPALNQTPVFLFYGTWLGFTIGRALAVQGWTRAFLRSIDEMVRTGEVGVWGVM